MLRRGVNNVQLLSDANVIKQGDTANGFEVQLLDKNGSPVNLTGSTVKWSMALMNGGKVLEKDAVVDDAAEGIVRLVIEADDNTGSGEMRVEIRVDDGNKVQKFPAYNYLRLSISTTLDDVSQVPVSYATIGYLTEKIASFEGRATEANVNSNEAISKSEEAIQTSLSTQTQLNEVVARETDSDAMSIQAATRDVNGQTTTFGTLKERIDDTDLQLTQRVTDTDFSNLKLMSNYVLTSDSPRGSYVNWAQGKCFKLKDTLFALYNAGDSHTASNLTPLFKVSRDNGISWSDEQILYEPTSQERTDYSKGVTCWGAGTDGQYIYAVLRFRGDTYNVGDSIHKLMIYNTASPDPHPTFKDISITSNGKVPILYHSFLYFDGKIGFGYHFEDGEIGVAYTGDRGNSWAKKIIYTSAEMGGTAQYAEPTFAVEGSVIYGALRTQSIWSYPNVLFYSTDNLATITKVPFTSNYAENTLKAGHTTLPIKVWGDKLIVHTSARQGQVNALTVVDRLALINENRLEYDTIILGSTGQPESGVSDTILDDNYLHIFFSENEKIMYSKYDLSSPYFRESKTVDTKTKAGKYNIEKTKKRLYANADLLNGWQLASVDRPIQMITDGKFIYITGEIKHPDSDLTGKSDIINVPVQTNNLHSFPIVYGSSFNKQGSITLDLRGHVLKLKLTSSLTTGDYNKVNINCLAILDNSYFDSFNVNSGLHFVKL